MKILSGDVHINIQEFNTISSYWEMTEYILPGSDSCIKVDTGSSEKIPIAPIKKIIYTENKKVLIEGDSFDAYGIDYYPRIDSSYSPELVKMINRKEHDDRFSVEKGKCIICFDSEIFFATIRIPSSYFPSESRYSDIPSYSAEKCCIISLTLFLDPSGKINYIKEQKEKKQKAKELEDNNSFNRFEYLDLS